MAQKTRLELTWIGKDQRPRLEPRILLEDGAQSYGAAAARNMMIHGDNLLALKALEQDFAGKIKCIYIDPPYNTGSAFEHYDDGVEHSIWLSMMRERLELLFGLLSKEGSIWISIDDNEVHYLKVLCDEIFGRKNFVSNVIWQKKYAAKSDSKYLSESHDHILVYAKLKESLSINRLERTSEQNSRYKNIDRDSRGPWTSGDLLRNEVREYAVYEVVSPSGRSHWPPTGTSWRFTSARFDELRKDNRIWFGADGNSVPRLKRFLSEVSSGVPATTIWTHKEVGHNDKAKKESVALFSESVFDTPKPEALIQRIFHVASSENDWVLDSFLGSGTTAAVAHKMGRKWIGIELGEHCATHCLPRLRQVVEGEDQGGISKAVDWRGGGGFHYYELAPSLLNRDEYGEWIIDERYNPAMLAAAMARHMNYRYAPDPDAYWKQGRSSEHSYIYTTTQFVTAETLDKLAAELRPEESLLICCRSFQESCSERHGAITICKIPKTLLGRCEFGREDYSLNIVNMPRDPDAPEFEPRGPQPAADRDTGDAAQQQLF